jgi:hypothetical protein
MKTRGLHWTFILSAKNICPLILLDSHSCHLIQVMTAAINRLQVECLQIPCGFTSFCQHVDIGIN